MTKLATTQAGKIPVLCFEFSFLDFEFVSIFEFRISNFSRWNLWLLRTDAHDGTVLERIGAVQIVGDDVQSAVLHDRPSVKIMPGLPTTLARSRIPRPSPVFRQHEQRLRGRRRKPRPQQWPRGRSTGPGVVGLVPATGPHVVDFKSSDLAVGGADYRDAIGHGRTGHDRGLVDVLAPDHLPSAKLNAATTP